MLEVFSYRHENTHLKSKTPSFPVRDGYGEYLAYPTSGSPLSKEQFEQFQKITQLAKQTYPETLDKVLSTSFSLFNYIGNAFGVHRSPIYSARVQWIQYKLNQADCPIQVFFLPKTLYDIVTTHAIEDPSFWHTQLGIQETSVIQNLFNKNRFFSLDEHKIPEEIFKRVSTDLAFRVNQHALAQLKHHQLPPVLNVSELKDLAISIFQTSPWYQKKWKSILQVLDPHHEKLASLLERVLQLECSVHPKSTILYRGSNSKTDSPQKKDGSFHSLSYGTSLIAGGMEEHKLELGGSPWVYCIQKENDCTAIEIPNQNKRNPFYIPQSELQMLGQGEFFHARTKMSDQVSDYEIKGLSTPGYLASLPFEIYSYPDKEFIRFEGTTEDLLSSWKLYHEKAISLK